LQISAPVLLSHPTRVGVSHRSGTSLAESGVRQRDVSLRTPYGALPWSDPMCGSSGRCRLSADGGSSGPRRVPELHVRSLPPTATFGRIVRCWLCVRQRAGTYFLF